MPAGSPRRLRPGVAMPSRFHLLLVPPALIAPAVVEASSFLTVEEAQQRLFPGANFTPADVVLSAAQVDELLRVSGAPVLRSRVKAWRVSGGGWFVVDQVYGRDDRITYAVGLDARGAVVGIEILVCDPRYQGVRHEAWRAQFAGAEHAGAAVSGLTIANISGSTMSVEHITGGVRRVLATHALFLAGAARSAPGQPAGR